MGRDGHIMAIDGDFMGNRWGSWAVHGASMAARAPFLQVASPSEWAMVTPDVGIPISPLGTGPRRWIRVAKGRRKPHVGMKVGSWRPITAVLE